MYVYMAFQVFQKCLVLATVLGCEGGAQKLHRGTLKCEGGAQKLHRGALKWCVEM